MILLGIDLGSNSGWARYDTDTRTVEWGHNRFGKLPARERVIEFGRWLNVEIEAATLDVNRDVAVGFERVDFSGPGRGGEFISRMEGVLQYLCREVAWVGVPVPTLKVFGTGDGRASKAAMIYAARYGLRTLGIRNGLDKLHTNEADAILVLAWMLENVYTGAKTWRR